MTIRQYFIMILLGLLVLQGTYSYTFNEKSLEVILVKTLTERYVDRLTRSLRTNGLQQSKNGALATATILPPFPAVYPIDPVSIDLDVTIPDPEIRVYGTVALTNNSGEPAVHGLDQIEELLDYTYIILTGRLNAAWNFKLLPRVSLEGSHTINLTVDVGTTVDVRGVGPLSAGADNIFVDLNTIIMAPTFGTMSMRELVIDLGFQNLLFDGGEEVYIGEGDRQTTVDWARVSDNLQTYFDTMWNDETKPIITEILRCSIDHAINGCNILVLVGGNTECLKIELKPSCFGLPDPPPTTTQNPTTTSSSEIPPTGPSSENPPTGPSSENPSTGPSSENPSTGPSSENPSTGPSSENPSTGPSSENPSTGPSSENPSTGPSSENPSTGPSSENPSTGPSSEDPAVTLTTSTQSPPNPSSSGTTPTSTSEQPSETTTVMAGSNSLMTSALCIFSAFVTIILFT